MIGGGENGGFTGGQLIRRSSDQGPMVQAGASKKRAAIILLRFACSKHINDALLFQYRALLATLRHLRPLPPTNEPLPSTALAEAT